MLKYWRLTLEGVKMMAECSWMINWENTPVRLQSRIVVWEQEKAMIELQIQIEE